MSKWKKLEEYSAACNLFNPVRVGGIQCFITTENHKLKPVAIIVSLWDKGNIPPRLTASPAFSVEFTVSFERELFSHG